MRCRLPIPSLIVIICERCRDEAKAFIKTVHLKAAQLKEVAIKLGKAGIAACVLCTAAIGPPAPRRQQLPSHPPEQSMPRIPPCGSSSRRTTS
jgi:hypothetical protein